nr:MAG TPA: hypothetical protein [Caudoviricetes sp.]DAY99880.1 MAG TPA: hypothetical protein [Caudoviricetes sp.]
MPDTATATIWQRKYSRNMITFRLKITIGNLGI